jgi:hypothetical protein
VEKEPFQAVDVGQEEEELGRLPHVLLVPGKPGDGLPKGRVPDPQDAIELGAGVRGGPLEGEKELLQVLLGEWARA